MKFDKLGWMIAAVMAGAMCGVGFQGSSQKFANVDMAKVFNDCDLTKANNEKLAAFAKKRFGVLQFIQQNSAMVPADATRYAEIGIKDNLTATETQDQGRISTDAQGATTKHRDLVIKQNATPDDLKQIQTYSAQIEQNKETVQRLEQQYDNDAAQMQQTLRNEVLEKVRQAVSNVASKDGYTVVFSSENAPFATNDLTPQALAAVNKK